MASALNGGADVISMPRYFKPWAEGLPALRLQLKPVAESTFFGLAQKQALAKSMRAAGLSPEQANSIPLTGRGPTMLAVLDPQQLTLRAILRAP